MKHMTILFLSIWMLACQSKKQTIRDFIPGTYVTKGENEHTKAVNELTIAVYDKRADVYTVRRKSTFQRKEKGQLQEKQVKEEEFKATFNPNTNQLEDPLKNRVFTFFPDQNTLMLNQAIYTKIK